MRRRLTIAVVALVAGALVVAGLGTLLLIRRAARTEAREELARQATAIADQADAASAQNLVVLRRAMQLEGAVVVAIGPAGRSRDRLPTGVTEGDLDVGRLRAGETVV